MDKKFRNKYRIESNRMPGWDYSANGAYFITIVTNNRKNWFGKIINEKMILSDFGKIADDEWNESFEIRNELYLDEYIIMPNHLHAIVIIKKNRKKNQTNKSNELNKFKDLHDFNILQVQTHGRASQSTQPGKSKNKTTGNNPNFKRKPESISSFIGGFKTASINKIDDLIDANNLKIGKFNRNNHLWQPNFHDHIIRNESEYFRIKNYIINNPHNWNEDKSNKEKFYIDNGNRKKIDDYKISAMRRNLKQTKNIVYL